jgi:SAM-dependent methyltransferase
MKAIERVHDGVVFGRRVRVLSRHIAGLLPEGARVVDVGCGDGSVARAVMDIRPDVRIAGIDVLVRPRTHIEVVPFDGRELPFGGRTVDAVTLVDVLHHTDDPVALLREVARVAELVIVKDHLADGVLARPTLRLMDWVGNAHFGVALPYNYMTTGRWHEMFRASGLTVETWQTSLALYPRPGSWLFDRGLHVLCRLSSRPGTG